MAPPEPSLPSSKSMKAACLVSDGVLSTEVNAEQPGAEHGQSSRLPQIVTIDDCKSWCDSFAEAAPPVKRISDAIAIFQEPCSRKRRAKLQRLCNPWAVAQYHAQKKRRLPEIEADLKGKIVKETQRLRKLHAQQSFLEHSHRYARSIARKEATSM